MTTTAGRARELRREQAMQAADRAEELRAELTRARIELEFFERGPGPDLRSPAPAAPRGSIRRSRRGGEPTRGVAVGLWFVAFYLLLVALAHGTPAPTASTASPASATSITLPLYQPASVAGADDAGS
ncbi:hypothetical protein [Arthrobacter sp. MDT1-65]